MRVRRRDWRAAEFFPPALKFFEDAYSCRIRDLAHPQQLFTAQLPLIERVIAIVCRRARVFDEDAEDFASQVKLWLIEDDYAVLRKYEGRSSLESYLTVVIQRMLADARTNARGRFRASSEAERLGPAAVLLEKLVLRDGRTLDEALPHIRAVDGDATPQSMTETLERLPERTARPREVQIEGLEERVGGAEPADARTLAAEARRLAQRAGQTIRDELDSLPAEDRTLIRFHYGEEMTIAEIARVLRLPQRPLYRRLQALLQRFRNALGSAGIDSRTASGLIGSEEELMNFLRDGEMRPAPPVHRAEDA